MAGGLKVHADHVHPRVDERFDEQVGVLDHEVGVKGQIGTAAELRHNRGAEGDVGDEMPVHDVEVDHVRPAPVHLGDLLAQATEIGGKKRGSNLDRAIEHGKTSFDRSVPDAATGRHGDAEIRALYYNLGTQHLVLSTTKGGNATLCYGTSFSSCNTPST